MQRNLNLIYEAIIIIVIVILLLIIIIQHTGILV